MSEKLNGRRMLHATLVIAAFCLVLSFFEPTFSSSIITNPGRQRGPIKAVGVGIYSDSQCTQVLVLENWGALDPGTSKNLTMYVRNEGRRAVSLSLFETNWNPSGVSQFVTLRWDYGGSLLSPGHVTEITLTLTLSPNAPYGLVFTFQSVVTSAG